MDIKQGIDAFRAERAQLEADMTAHLAALAAGFYLKTGVHVTSMTVSVSQPGLHAVVAEGFTREDYLRDPPIIEVHVHAPISR